MIRPSICDPALWTEVKPFFYNEGFTVLSGGKYWIRGKLSFPNGAIPVVDSTYRTMFGPAVHHTGLIYSNCNNNLAGGMTRMTALRPPTVDWEIDVSERISLLTEVGAPREVIDELQRRRYLSYSAMLTENQRIFIEEHQWFLHRLREMYVPHLHDYLGAEEECVLHHADPHSKKQPRVEAYTNLLHTTTLFTRKWVSEVVYKMKKNEWAKFGKYARMIGDLGVEASLHGFRLTGFLKEAQYNRDLIINGVNIVFVKSPSQRGLRSVFNQLINPPARGYFCYFSDDSCFSIRIHGHVYTFNLDISSCDASHTRYLFEALLAMTPLNALSDMENLIEQLRCPIRIYSCDDRRKSVLIKSKVPILLSGSTLTTLINNVANELIGVSLAETDFSGARSVSDAEVLIIAAARRVGYVITCQRCETYSDIQFLKHSPVYDTTGRLQPLLNVGVLLRLTGVCDRDLPGRGPLEERARLFQQELLRGVYPTVRFELIDRMRLSMVGEEPTPSMLKWIRHIQNPSLAYKVVREDQDEHFTVEMGEIYKRYPAITASAGCELVDDLGGATFGDVVACEAASHILMKDYGLHCL